MAKSTRSKPDPSPSGTDSGDDGTRQSGRNSRLATAASKRAAEKALGPMSASKDIDPDLKLEINRVPPDLSDGTKKSRAAPKANKPLDKGSAKTGGVTPDTPVATRVTRSNADIAEAATGKARRSPAPRPPRAEGAVSGEAKQDSGKPASRAGTERRRAPAPGNVVTRAQQKATRGRNRPGSDR